MGAIATLYLKRKHRGFVGVDDGAAHSLEQNVSERSRC